MFWWPEWEKKSRQSMNVLFLLELEYPSSVQASALLVLGFLGMDWKFITRFSGSLVCTQQIMGFLSFNNPVNQFLKYMSFYISFYISIFICLCLPIHPSIHSSILPSILFVLFIWRTLTSTFPMDWNDLRKNITTYLPFLEWKNYIFSDKYELKFWDELCGLDKWFSLSYLFFSDENIKWRICDDEFKSSFCHGAM